MDRSPATPHAAEAERREEAGQLPLARLAVAAVEEGGGLVVDVLHGLLTQL